MMFHLVSIVIPLGLQAEPVSRFTGLVPLYIGPDQMLPVMSALGAVLGVLLMFWHRSVALLRKGLRFVGAKLGLRKRRSAIDTERP